MREALDFSARLLMALAAISGAAFLLAGCATFQQPKPVGAPSPLACYGAKRTREAWEGLVRKYVDEMMQAQEAYSCQQPSPPEPVPMELTPSGCAR